MSWDIYDRMIDGIPTDWLAEEIAAGTHYSYVRSRDGLGIGGVMDFAYRLPMATRTLEGAPLREVAGLIKSWNYAEAGVGLAALNAYYNHPETARRAGVAIADSRHVEDRIYDPFIMSQNEIRGKKVTVLGHFPHIETLFEPICDMRIVEGEEPEDGDYPFPAVEYLLPESDFIFIGSACFLEKTLPRLLELSKNARKVTIVGPSTTLAPVLFAFGVHDLSGFVVKDVPRAMRMIRGAEPGKIFATGQKVAFTCPAPAGPNPAAPGA